MNPHSFIIDALTDAITRSEARTRGSSEYFPALLTQMTVVGSPNNQVLARRYYEFERKLRPRCSGPKPKIRSSMTMTTTSKIVSAAGYPR